MASSDPNIKDVINYFIKCDLEEEKNFIENQEKAGIKIRDRVFMEKTNGKNQLKIETQLSVNKDENSCTGRDGDGKDDAGFFISSFKVATDDSRNTNIITVVRNKDSDLEAVYSATMEQKGPYRKLAYHNSYVRPRTLSHTNSLNIPKEDMVQQREAVPAQDTDQIQIDKPKKKRTISWKHSKKGMKPVKKDTESKNKESLSASSSTKRDNEAKKPKESRKQFVIKGEVPFNSYQIGSDSGKMRNILSRNKDRSKSTLGMSQMARPVKIVSTKEGQMNGQKSDTFTVIIDKTEESDMFKAITSVDKDNYSDGESIFENEPEPSPEATNVDSQIFLSPQRQPDLRRHSLPAIVCDCCKQRLQLITETIIRLNEGDMDSKKESLSRFDPVFFHFRGCEYYEFKMSKIEKWRPSQATLHAHCDSCDRLDYPISPYLCKSMTSLVFDHEDNEDAQIQLTEKELQFFVNNRCYDHFESNMLNFLGSKFNAYHLSRLFYIIRTIVRHLGDPRDKHNSENNRIIQFFVMFYGHHFFPHIKSNHTSFEDFLMNCECDNFEGVD